MRPEGRVADLVVNHLLQRLAILAALAAAVRVGNAGEVAAVARGDDLRDDAAAAHPLRGALPIEAEAVELRYAAQAVLERRVQAPLVVVLRWLQLHAERVLEVAMEALRKRAPEGLAVSALILARHLGQVGLRATRHDGHNQPQQLLLGLAAATGAQRAAERVDIGTDAVGLQLGRASLLGAVE